MATKTPAQAKKPAPKRMIHPHPQLTRPDLVPPPLSTVPVEPPADPLVIRELELRLERLSEHFTTLSEENLELRGQVRALEAVGTVKDVGKGESEAIIRQLTCERNAMTSNLARAVDALRSASVSAHRSEGHRGGYESCSEPVCRVAGELWALIGEGQGVDRARKDPVGFWDERRQDAMPIEPDLAIATEVEEESPPAVTLGEPVEVDPEDMGWDEKHHGKGARRLHVPDPEKEKDPDDPGMPKKARV